MDFASEVRKAVGPALTEEELDDLIPVAFADLEQAVGSALAEGLSDEQLAEFEELIDCNDHKGASAWLEAHRPDYPAVVEHQLALLLGRLAEGLGG